jgi:hypothetical protein
MWRADDSMLCLGGTSFSACIAIFVLEASGQAEIGDCRVGVCFFQEAQVSSEVREHPDFRGST